MPNPLNCQSYLELSVIEKTQLVGKVIHLMQSDETALRRITQMIADAEKNGFFKDVKFALPNKEKPY